MSSDPRVKERFRSWYEAYAQFAKYYESSFPDWEVQLDFAALYHAVVSYFHDVERYKVWHMDKPDARINDVKKASFSLYWLAKYRPVRLEHRSGLKSIIQAGSPVPDDYSVIANHLYACLVAYSYLGYCYEEAIEYSIVYMMQYRPATAETFITIIQALDDARRLKDTAFSDMSYTAAI